MYIVCIKWTKYFSCLLSVWNGANMPPDHCQVQMTSCDANPDGGEEGGTKSGEAIPKILDIL